MKANDALRVSGRHGTLLILMGGLTAMNCECSPPADVTPEASGLSAESDGADHLQPGLPVELLRVFGSHVDAGGVFHGPFGVRLGREGDLYIADDLAHAIHVFRTDGTYVRSMGRQGHRKGQLAWLDAVDFDSLGFLFIADTGNNRIQVWDPLDQFVADFGRAVRHPGRPLQNPRDVLVVDDRTVYVADFNGGRVQVFDRDGTSLRVIGEAAEGYAGLKGPIQLTRSPDGLLYVSDVLDHRVHVFSADGKFVRAFGGQGNGAGKLDSPHRLEFGPDGWLYVCDYGNDRIQVFDPDGAVIGSCVTPQSHPLKQPTDLCFDEAGRLYVVDKGHHRIQVWRVPAGDSSQ